MIDEYSDGLLPDGFMIGEILVEDESLAVVSVVTDTQDSLDLDRALLGRNMYTDSVDVFMFGSHEVELIAGMMGEGR